MKKYLLGALITLTGLFVLAAGVQAATGDVVVHINQDFVAGGKAFPAGTYKVLQDVTGTGQALILRGEPARRIGIPRSKRARLVVPEAAGSEADASGRCVLPERSND